MSLFISGVVATIEVPEFLKELKAASLITKSSPSNPGPVNTMF